MAPIRAAQYARMSTERQEYSIEHQLAAITAYALEGGYDIVRTYVDAGISGLGIRKREGLKHLLEDVISDSSHFDVILVYDVSRWGRFQNPDQAAYYEFLCAEAGVRIEYCAEQFKNDGTITANLLKSLKRAMAAEYSRELSAKVALAQERLAARGFWQGGPPGYGFCRQQVRADGSRGRSLKAGDRKGAQNGRTILVHGPQHEVDVVRRIFETYAAGKGTRVLANRLNAEGVPAPRGGRWEPTAVQSILRNERYVGTMVRGKQDRRMGRPTKRRPEAEWARTDNAFEPIVSRRLFSTVQRKLAKKRRRFTKDEMLEGLRRIYARAGRLNRAMIDNDANTPSAALYQRHFGSLIQAYSLVGYEVTGKQAIGCRALEHRRDAIKRHPSSRLSDEQFVYTLQSLLAQHGRLNAAIIDGALGRWAYRAGTQRFGGGRRMFALAGYAPNERQARTFAGSASELITEQEAEELRKSVMAGRR